ncbi:MAG: bifunctional riboflavin kinase/FAD synthetase [Myxococcota bacterium]
MRVYRGSAGIAEADRGCVLTIGNFDGVHLGHQALLAALLERARIRRCPAVVYTFHPHPRQVLAPERAQKLLMTFEQLAAELERRGIDALIQEPFDRTFASLTAEAFLRDVIHARIAPEAIFVGRDFHFGKGRAGGDQTLARIGPDLGIRVTIIPQVSAGGRDVSSTRIRQALAEGRVDEARLCLGRPYAIRGRVVEGERRGRTLGFPTANLEVENEILPANGVYATWLRRLGHPADGCVRRASVTNIGVRPTFEPGRVLCETHLLDFDGDLYGERVELGFVSQLRGERRFPSPEALAEQIARDASSARTLLDG